MELPVGWSNKKYEYSACQADGNISKIVENVAVHDGLHTHMYFDDNKRKATLVGGGVTPGKVITHKMRGGIVGHFVDIPCCGEIFPYVIFEVEDNKVSLYLHAEDAPISSNPPPPGHNSAARLDDFYCPTVNLGSLLARLEALELRLGAIEQTPPTSRH